MLGKHELLLKPQLELLVLSQLLTSGNVTLLKGYKSTIMSNVYILLTVYQVLF